MAIPYGCRVWLVEYCYMFETPSLYLYIFSTEKSYLQQIYTLYLNCKIHFYKSFSKAAISLRICSPAASIPESIFIYMTPEISFGNSKLPL